MRINQIIRQSFIKKRAFLAEYAFLFPMLEHYGVHPHSCRLKLGLRSSINILCFSHLCSDLSYIRYDSPSFVREDRRLPSLKDGSVRLRKVKDSWRDDTTTGQTNRKMPLSAISLLTTGIIEIRLPRIKSFQFSSSGTSLVNHVTVTCLAFPISRCSPLS